MKSLRYTLGGNPHNLDDCLDYYLKKEKLLEVSIDIATREKTGEMYILKQLLGVFTWKFSGIDVRYKEIEGVFFYDQTKKSQRIEINKANIRLENKLNHLKMLGIDVTGKKKRFDYSMTY